MVLERKEKFWSAPVWNLVVNIFGLWIRFGITVSLEIFASAFALVRRLLALLVSILVSVPVPELMKRPLILLFGLIGASGFMA